MADTPFDPETFEVNPTALEGMTVVITGKLTQIDRKQAEALVERAGRALGTYLKRKKKWQQLKADAEAVSEVLVPYTFRHRYAKASHQKNDPVIPLANIASAMGHTIPVHLENYARFTPDRTAELYDAE